MDFQLTEADVRSPLWRRLSDALAVELQALRERNDSRFLGEIDTADVRARIDFCKQMLALADQASAGSNGPLGTVVDDDEQMVPLAALRS